MGALVKLLPVRLYPRSLLSFSSEKWGSFWRSQLGSVLATSVDFAATFLFTELLAVWYVFSTSMGAALGAVTHFLIARYWAFQSGSSLVGYLDPHSIQFFRYLLVSVTSLLLNTGLVYALTEAGGVPYGISKLLCSIGVGVAFNFPMHDRFVFRRQSVGVRLVWIGVGLYLGLNLTQVQAAPSQRESFDSLERVVARGAALQVGAPVIFGVEKAVAVYGRAIEVSGAGCPADWRFFLRQWEDLRKSSPEYGWTPRKASELKHLTQCQATPCFVKLAPEEGSQMGQVEMASRLDRWESLVNRRVSEYRTHGRRLSYEKASSRFEPWKLLRGMGLKGVPTCSSSEDRCVWSIDPHQVEKWTLTPQDEKPIRQVLDHRTWEDQGLEVRGTVTRDIYSEHYFESWGEWVQWECVKGQLQMKVWIVWEVDLLAKNDFFVRMARSKIIDGIIEKCEQHFASMVDRARRSLK